MNKWEIDVLGNHVSLITKGTTPTSLGRAFQENGINFIKAESITDSGRFIASHLAFIDEETHELLKRSQLRDKDILFSIAGVLGRVAIIYSEILPANTNQAIAIIRLSSASGIENEFLKYFLNSEFLKEQIRRINVQAAQANFSLENINKLLIQFPKDKKIQQRIAFILSTADAVIEKTQEAIAKYKAIKQGMLHDLFTRGIDLKTGKLRPTKTDAPELYKECKLGWIPKEWEEKPLSDIVDRLSPVTYGIVQPGSFDQSGVLLIRGQDYISGWAKEPEFFRVAEKLHNQFIRSKTVNGDILMCIVGGAVAVVPDWIEEANITQTTARIRCDKNTFSPLFLEYYLKSDFGKYFINKYVKGSAQPGLNLGDVDKFIIRFPKQIDEQKDIGIRMKSIDDQITSEQKYLYKMQGLKAGLMNDLLSGKKEVRVKEEIENLA